MIIFSQRPAKHSRIGNSFVWMSKFKFLLDHLGVEACFPWAVENFGSYLEENSYWMQNNLPHPFFKSKFGMDLTAENLWLCSRRIEHQYELSYDLNASEWKTLILTDPDLKLLYLAGAIDITDRKIHELINNHQHTIIQNPYKFSFNDPNLKLQDYSLLVPKKVLFESQSTYINERSGGKRKVGFHIRRGDYKKWEGGIYYFDDTFWIEKVQFFINNGDAVWIFSDEVNSILNNALKAQGAFISSESYEIDFVRMFFMDEIYGPPSTFSNTAVKIANSIFGLDLAMHYLKPLE
jgi:hypothetical protein